MSPLYLVSELYPKEDFATYKNFKEKLPSNFDGENIIRPLHCFNYVDDEIDLLVDYLDQFINLSNLENHADIHLSANQLIGAATYLSIVTTNLINAAIKCPENESALNFSKNKIMYMHNEDKDK